MTLDLLCTFYDYTELGDQVSQFKDSHWPVHYICNWENPDDVKSEASKYNAEVNWLNFNPDQHLGTFGLASAASEFAKSDYVLHYHADMIFDDPSRLDSIFEDFVKSGKPVGSIPRQWCFNGDVFVDNKSVPFRTELFFMKSEIYRSIFDMAKYDELRENAVRNGHASEHYEPIVYAGLEGLGINCTHDIHYFPTVKEMKHQLGNNIVYYNTKFGDTGIWRKK